MTNLQQGDSPRSTPVPHHTNRGRQKGPHLIVASNEELHKWRHYLRIWHLDRRIQLYDGAGQASHYREKLQQDGNISFQFQPMNDKGEGDFLLVSPNEYDEGFDDDEPTEPVYCVLCPVDAFIEDRQAFVNFAYWQMVVVENDHGDQFDAPICVSALQQLRQQQRRILCNGIAIENWKNTASRLQYAEFLVREAPSLNTTSVCECSQHRMETCPVQGLQVERSSVAKVMQAYGKSPSVRAALWKAASQQGETPKYMNALLLALSCLSLRRVRSEVEQELCKIEEISLSCLLSISQSAQYRSALSGFAATLASAGGREDRLGVWLQLLLRLRQICNSVDLVNDMEKLGHAGLRLLTSCSAKLETLEPLLRRLVYQESKKMVIYYQFHGMFPVLELFLSLLDISYVDITGSIAMQSRSLCHFAGHPVVRVALASTRLSAHSGGQAVSIFGSEAIVVVDGDWNATCDAKLRAS
ncbi:hypothetical protein PsorP6_001522 [Peronosclerospora sorghi]|uniref:Uncharacterized protein n=1 Tax=Peronosclerospora sorghi TaxID=230839 RepID=A0ACC0WR43_9STRA|nr:hypothetical protein PsorP6_001522 [Peronosclerospora sorghi]